MYLLGLLGFWLLEMLLDAGSLCVSFIVYCTILYCVCVKSTRTWLELKVEILDGWMVRLKVKG